MLDRCGEAFLRQGREFVLGFHRQLEVNALSDGHRDWEVLIHEPRRVAAVLEHLQRDGEVGALAFRHYELPADRAHLHDGRHTHVVVVAAERDLDVADASHELLLHHRDLHQPVAVHDRTLTVPGRGAAAGQGRGQRVVRGGLRGQARQVVESELLAIHSGQQGLGGSDSHLGIPAADDGTFDWRTEQNWR